jgi:proline iminopeptidase
VQGSQIYRAGQPICAPPISQSDWLNVGGAHSIYWETIGQRHGIPVLYLHGGPGGGCTEEDRRWFNPAHHFAILHDQRGAGRSVPSGEIVANDTSHLIDDIERLRKHLGVDQWYVFGGSWGTTLALAYGQVHPQRCLGFILRGTWLFTQEEMESMFVDSVPYARKCMEQLEHLVGSETATDIDAFMLAAKQKVHAENSDVSDAVALAWLNYEWALCGLPALNTSQIKEAEYKAMALIGTHYMRHRGFLQSGQLLTGISRIAHLPAHIVHGERDRVCPLATAQELHAHWPGSQLHVVSGEGHVDSTPGMESALFAALAAFTS